jgi:hypothetical protein
MTTDDIINLFGGRGAISAITGAKGNAITQWKQAGVPAKFWHVLVGEAGKRGIDGVTFEALAATRQPRPRDDGSPGALTASAA